MINLTIPAKTKEVGTHLTEKAKDIVEASKDFKIKDAISYKKRVHSKTKLVAIVSEKGYTEIVPAKFVGENKIGFKLSDGTLKTPYIFAHPTLMEISLGRFKRKERAIAFHVGRRAECTHDPMNSTLDIPTIQMANELCVSLIKNDVIDAMSKAAEGKKLMREYIPWAVIALLMSIVILVMGDVIHG